MASAAIELPSNVDRSRWDQVIAKGLGEGSHDDIASGVCAMEAVAYITREPWSDHPTCVCPVIGAFMRAWNDGLPDAERSTVILPLIPLTIGTAGSQALAERRSLLPADWLVREHTPAWLRLAGLTTQADALAGLPEIVSLAQVPSIRGPIEAARHDAAAARAAAGDAARAKLQPVRLELQRSAGELVRRMCALTEDRLPDGMIVDA